MRVLVDERRAHLSLIQIMSLLCVIFALAVPILGLPQAMLIGAVLGLLAYSGLWFAYIRGWALAGIAAVVLTTAIVAVSMILDPETRVEFSPVFFVPVIFSLIYMGPLGTTITGLAMLAIMLVALPYPNPYADPLRVILVTTITIGAALARAVLDTMRYKAEQEALMAQAARAQAERETAIAQAQARELAEREREQKRLLDLVSDLETPTVALSDGVYLAPMIGSLDSRRAEKLISRLLESVSRNRVRLLIVDLAGVRVIDTLVAEAIGRLVASVRLLGCEVVITGIAAEVAMTLAQIGATFASTATARSPQEALTNYLQRQAPRRGQS